MKQTDELDLICRLRNAEQGVDYTWWKGIIRKGDGRIFYTSPEPIEPELQNFTVELLYEDELSHYELILNSLDFSSSPRSPRIEEVVLSYMNIPQMDKLLVFMLMHTNLDEFQIRQKLTSEDIDSVVDICKEIAQTGGMIQSFDYSID